MARLRVGKFLYAALIASLMLLPTVLLGADLREEAGIGVGLTAGNVVSLPAKAVSLGVALPAGLLSFIVTGGDTEVTRQIWQNSTEGPYLITPGVAKKAIGERPELREKEASAPQY